MERYLEIQLDDRRSQPVLQRRCLRFAVSGVEFLVGDVVLGCGLGGLSVEVRIYDISDKSWCYGVARLQFHDVSHVDHDPEAETHYTDLLKAGWVLCDC